MAKKRKPAGLGVDQFYPDPKAPRRKMAACKPVVQTHDGGYLWEAACACGWRSVPTLERDSAVVAAEKHDAKS